jgi:hypothetical protein
LNSRLPGKILIWDKTKKLVASLKNDIFSIQNVNLRWPVLPEQLYNKIKEIMNSPFFDSKSAQIMRQQ